MEHFCFLEVLLRRLDVFLGEDEAGTSVHIWRESICFKLRLLHNLLTFLSFLLRRFILGKGRVLQFDFQLLRGCLSVNDSTILTQLDSLDAALVVSVRLCIYPRWVDTSIGSRLHTQGINTFRPRSEN